MLNEQRINLHLASGLSVSKRSICKSRDILVPRWDFFINQGTCLSQMILHQLWFCPPSSGTVQMSKTQARSWYIRVEESTAVEGPNSRWHIPCPDGHWIYLSFPQGPHPILRKQELVGCRAKDSSTMLLGIALSLESDPKPNTPEVTEQGQS